MSAPLNLDEIRRVLREAPDQGAEQLLSHSTRGFLEQVVAEIAEGRAAVAQLAIARGMAAVTDTLLTGAA